MEQIVKKFLHQNWWLFISMLLLSAAGIAFIRSAQLYSDIPLLHDAWINQTRWFCIGLVVYLILIQIDYSLYIKLAIPIYVVGVLMLTLTFVPGFGLDVNHSKSWVKIPGIPPFQPVEITKISTIIMLAAFLGRTRLEVRHIKYFILAGIILGVPMLLILKQPDLGSALVFVPIFLSIAFVAGIRKSFLILLLACGMAGSVAVYNDMVPGVKLKKYQKERLISFLEPEKYRKTSGYMLIQMRVAIGTGGIWGKGYTQSTQTRAEYIPKAVAHSDAIFAVIGEEVGFLGCTVILLVFAGILMSGTRIALFARDTYGRLLCAGIIAMLFAHLYENVGMTLGVMPITGIPLPFISNGGSFMVISMAAVAILQSVWIHRRNYS